MGQFSVYDIGQTVGMVASVLVSPEDIGVAVSKASESDSLLNCI